MTLLNRLGHCEGYKFSLELETALSKAIDEASPLLSPNILKGISNEVFYSVWDNCDFKLSATHGPSTYHTSNGLMCQELSAITDAPGPKDLPQTTRYLLNYLVFIIKSIIKIVFAVPY